LQDLDWQQIIGLVAGAMITVSFVPQIVKLFRLKSAHEISLPFTLLQLTGGIMFLVYGVLLSLPAIIATNIITSALAALIVYAKFKYGR
jgi:MtN3 and saliva related transmembrane protein